jgi:signal transduction histidine kinase/CheY-like chemotaxis protein
MKEQSRIWQERSSIAPTRISSLHPQRDRPTAYYTIGSLISQTTTRRIMKGRSSDERDVVLSRVRSPGDARHVAEELLREGHRFELGGSLQFAEVVDNGTDSFLVLDAGPSMPQHPLLVKPGEPLPRVLSVLRGLFLELEQWHERGLLHGAVCPEAFGCTREGKVVTLTLSHAVPLAPLRMAGLGVAGTDRDLRYTAPECTGRLRQPVDERADLYSAGVLCYELLTGKVPFGGGSAMSMVHAHLSQSPPSLLDGRPDTPAALVDLVARLLAKDPRERPSSAGEVRAQLDGLLGEQEGRTPDPRRARLSPRFEVVKRLYGRERELGELEQCLRKSAQARVEILRVMGPSGAGKTTLIEEALRRSSAVQALQGRGKVDTASRQRPFGVLLEALACAFAELLSEENAVQIAARERLQTRLGPLAACLLPYLPVLRRFFPDLQPVDLSPAQAHIQIPDAFAVLLASLGGPRRPLILWLDDLQWADDGTLRVLHHFQKRKAEGALCLLLSYRTGEPGSALVEEVLGAGSRMELGPLQEDVLVGWVREMLRTDHRAAELARHVHLRSGGNPHLIVEIFHRWAQEGFFSPQEGGTFHWSEKLLGSGAGLGGVVGLLGERFARLSGETRWLLGVAACLGREVTVGALADAAQVGPEVAMEALERGMQRDLLFQRLGPPGGGGQATFGFVHDQIQVLARAGLGDQSAGILLRLALHGDPGVDRIRRGEHLLEALAQGARVGATEEPVWELLGGGAEDALLQGDFALAQRFLWVERDLLGGAPKERRGRNALRLAEVALFQGQHGQAERLAAECRELTADPVVLARAELVSVRLQVALGNLEGAQRLALRALEPMETGPWSEQSMAELQERVRRHLEQAQHQGALGWPALEDPLALVTIDLLDEVLAAAYQRADFEAFSFAVLSVIDLSARRGRSPSTAYALMVYSMLLLVGRHYEQARAHAQGVLALVDGMESGVMKGRAEFVYGHFVAPLLSGPMTAADRLRSASAQGALHGDLLFASYAHVGLAMGAMLSWRGLGELLDAIDASRPFYEQHPHLDASRFLVRLRRFVGFLQSQGDEPLSSLPQASGEVQSPTFQLYEAVTRAAFYLLFGQLRAAGEELELAAPLLPHGLCSHAAIIATCLEAVVLGQQCLQGLPSEQQTRAIERMLALREDLVSWAQASPSAAHLVALVDLELAMQSGALEQVCTAADQALLAARRSSDRFIEILAANHAAGWLTRRGLLGLAQGFRALAHGAAMAYGSPCIARAINAPFLEDQSPLPRLQAPASLSLDAEAIFAAYRALSRRRDPQEQAVEMLRVLIEASGASRAILVRAQHGAFRDVVLVEAHHTRDGVPLMTDSELFLSLTPLLDEAISSNKMLLQRRNAFHGTAPLARLLLPMEAQTGGHHVLLFENDHLSCAFDGARSEFLSVVCGLLCTALDNAEIFQDHRQALAELREANQRNVEQNQDLIRKSVALDHINQQLKSALEEARESAKARARFLGAMSHRLHTPLHKVFCALDILAQLCPTDEIWNQVEDIRAASQELHNLIARVIDLAEGEQGQITVEEGDFSLLAVCRIATDKPARDALRKGIRLDIELSEAVIGPLYGDAGRIGGMLEHLCSNAVQFTSSGGVTVRGAMSSIGGVSLLRLQVIDTGPGIDDAVRTMLQVPWGQQVPSEGEVHRGVGLSLSHVHRSAHLLGGRFQIGKRPEGGTEAVLELPVQSIPMPSFEPPAGLTLAPGTLLLVEDEPLNRKNLSIRLRKSGHQVHAVADGREAVEAFLAARGAISCILMDCNMPVLDGFRATAQIRAIEHRLCLPRSKIIAVTANALSTDRGRCLAAGMDLYLKKPIGPQEMALLLSWLPPPGSS